MLLKGAILASLLMASFATAAQNEWKRLVTEGPNRPFLGGLKLAKDDAAPAANGAPATSPTSAANPAPTVAISTTTDTGSSSSSSAPVASNAGANIAPCTDNVANLRQQVAVGGGNNGEPNFPTEASTLAKVYYYAAPYARYIPSFNEGKDSPLTPNDAKTVMFSAGDVYPDNATLYRTPVVVGSRLVAIGQPAQPQNVLPQPQPVIVQQQQQQVPFQPVIVQQGAAAVQQQKRPRRRQQQVFAAPQQPVFSPGQALPHQQHQPQQHQQKGRPQHRRAEGDFVM